MLILVPDSSYSSGSFQVEKVRAFVSPDSSYGELERLIGEADASIYVNTYTITSHDVANLLEDANLRGIEVILMLDGSPVGGVSNEEEVIADRLSKAGSMVCFYSSNKTRFNHAKYIIADNYSTLITTENLGRTGFPKKNSYGGRGWGIVIYDRVLSESLAGLFFSDLADCRRRELSEGEHTRNDGGGAYESRHPAREFIGTYHLELFTAPEEGIEPILRLLESANESIFVEQAYIYEHWGRKRDDTPETAPNLFLETVVNAARRGVKVRILLDSYWYNVLEDDPVSNLRTLEYVNTLAREERLDLEAKLIDLDELGLMKLHTKGVIVDENTVLVSSINWNEHSPTKNREIGVIIYGELAGYYTEVFECDWEPSSCGSKQSTWIYILGILLIPIAYLVRKRALPGENPPECG
ncbi:MAG: phosphatidylserine/phosphatidylglycerophosphate/cardiolipin synthase family protein [Candidatus Hydrothermarchaeaceae archaeon]